MVVLTRGPAVAEIDLTWDPVKGLPRVERLEGTDAVVNLNGAPLAARPWTRARREVLLASRIDATRTLLGILERLERPPAVFVGVGALGMFSDAGDERIDDDAPRGEGFLAELSGAWEDVQLSAESLGCRSSVLRMSIVLSPTGGALPPMVVPFRYGFGGWLGNGQQFTPWISIDDCVAALIHLIDHDDCRGGFNGTVPEPLRNRAWCEALGHALQRPVYTHAPKWALKGALGELANEIFLASRRAHPRKLLESGFEFADTDIEATFRRLLTEVEPANAPG